MNKETQLKQARRIESEMYYELRQGKYFMRKCYNRIARKADQLEENIYRSGFYNHKSVSYILRGILR
jgi:hypothetical protein